jgi:hypothetical protein
LFLLLQALQQRVIDSFDISLSEYQMRQIIFSLGLKGYKLMSEEDFINAEQVFTLIFQLNNDENALRKVNMARTEQECQ